MTHTVEVAQYKKLSNGQVSLCLRCCGNASTDHWHTMDVSVASDPEKRAASLEPIRAFISQQHDAAIKAEAGALAELGNISQHDHV